MVISLCLLIRMIIGWLQLLILLDIVISYLILFGADISSTTFVRLIKRSVAPILDPLRRALPPSRTFNLDFSPMIALFILQLIARMLPR